MLIPEQLTIIAKSISKVIIAADKWQKFDSSSTTQGWKRIKDDNTWEYRYQDTDPNLENSDKPEDSSSKKTVDNSIKVIYNSYYQQTLPHKVENLGGSTGAKKITDEDGNAFVIKTYENNGGLLQIKNELLANILYRTVNYNSTPVSSITEFNGKPALKTKFINSNSEEKLTKEAIRLSEGIKDTFVMDCWLANWDSIGLEYDNVVKQGYSGFTKVDNGGALMFRAQGGLKGDKFSDEVGELKTLRDPSINPTSAYVYQGITETDILKQVTRIVKNFSNDRITGFANAVFDQEPETAQFIANKLIKRRDYLKNVAMEIAKKLIKEKKIERKDKFNISQKQQPGQMTEKEREDLYDYTGNGYYLLNKELREKTNFGEEDPTRLEMVKSIVSGLSKLPAYTKTCWRGSDLDEVTMNFLVALKPGDIMYSKAFLSTSSDAYNAFSSPSIKFEIQSKTGRDVSALSSHPGEKEILFTPDTRFRISESIFNPNENNFTVKMEEILPGEDREKTPVNFNIKKGEMNPEDIRKFLLNNPKLTPAQREKIMKLSPEELKKVIIAIFSKSKNKGSKGKSSNPAETTSDKFTEIFI